jgi:hypothetical protein
MFNEFFLTKRLINGKCFKISPLGETEGFVSKSTQGSKASKEPNSLHLLGGRVGDGGFF